MPKERRKLKPITELKREGLPPCKYYLSTGSTLLDLAISDRYPGGVGSGRVVHIYGDNSTAKSVLAQEILGSAQRMGGHAIFEDAEITLDFDRAQEIFGLHTGLWNQESLAAIDEDEYVLENMIMVDNKFTYRVPESIEGLFDEEIGPTCQLIQDKRLNQPVAMGIDTFSALPSLAEAKAEQERQKKISRECGEAARVIAERINKEVQAANPGVDERIKELESAIAERKTLVPAERHVVDPRLPQLENKLAETVR